MEEKAMVREQSPGVMRRFLARQFDVSLCAAVVTAVLTLGFRVNVLQLGWVLSWVASAAGLLILLLTEPLFLHLWGTTPGKWVLGMRIYDPSRSHIDYGDGKKFKITKKARYTAAAAVQMVLKRAVRSGRR